MKNFIFLISTAFTVSIDSFFAGFSLAKKTKKATVVFGTASMVYLLCVIANYLGVLLEGILTEDIASMGGSILILIGIYNLATLRKEEKKIGSTLTKALITGFGVGLDGACANLSLAIMGMNAFYVPLTIAIMHLVMIYLGLLTSNTALSRITERYGYIPPLTLIALGLYKIVPVIISFF